MTEAERRLLIWCGVMLVRSTPLTSAEADEIDQIIADVRSFLRRERDAEEESGDA